MNAEVSSVNWVHPSVRDTVIEYLMDHDFHRQRFLATARASGAVMALSTAGGALGTRQRPLLRSVADWDALNKTVHRIGSGADIREQYILLQGVGEALRASEGDEEVSNLTRNLTIRLLSELRLSWDSRTEAITIGALAVFYDLSVQVGYLVPSPNLSLTWREAVTNLESALNSEVKYYKLGSVSHWIRTTKMLRDNEPRFLRIEMTEEEVEDRIRSIFGWIQSWSDGLMVLIEDYLKLNSKKYRLITALNESEKVRSGRR